jgi:hypothetical protein
MQGIWAAIRVLLPASAYSSHLHTYCTLIWSIAGLFSYLQLWGASHEVMLNVTSQSRQLGVQK